VIIGATGGDGSPIPVRGRCVNLSEDGFAVVLQEPLEVRSLVTFQIEKLGLRGTGSVRHCRRIKRGYAAGIAFSSGLKQHHYAYHGSRLLITTS
jgi:hypothetical protein